MGDNRKIMKWERYMHLEQKKVTGTVDTEKSAIEIVSIGIRSFSIEVKTVQSHPQSD